MKGHVPMPRAASHRLFAFYCAVVAIGSAAGSTAIALPAAAMSQATAPTVRDACSLLTPADIAKSTGLNVANGTAGQVVPGTLGKCTWTGAGDTKVIVTLADAQHMQITLAVQLQGGGTAVGGWVQRP
jgi:hypothetical protein